MDSFFPPLDFTNQPWVGIGLILAAAALSVAIIVFTTRRSVNAVASAATGALLEASSLRAEEAGSGEFSSVGRGEVHWSPGGYSVVLSRPVSGTSPDEDLAVQPFIAKLKAANWDPQDVEDPELLEPGQGRPVRTVTIRIHVRDGARLQALLALAHQEGFSEKPNDHWEEISLDDAHVEAGRRAMADVIRNIGIVADHLNISRQLVELSTAQLETVSVPGENASNVCKVARTTWRKGRA